MGRLRSATRSSIAVARQENSCIYNKICCSLVNSKTEFSSWTLGKVKETLVLSLFFVSCEEKHRYRVFSVGQLGLTAARTAGTVVSNN